MEPRVRIKLFVSGIDMPEGGSRPPVQCGLMSVLNASSFQGHLATLDLQVSKVPKADKEVLGFQGSQDPPVIPVKEVLQGPQDNQDFLELLVVQVSATKCQNMKHLGVPSLQSGSLPLTHVWLSAES